MLARVRGRRVAAAATLVLALAGVKTGVAADPDRARIALGRRIYQQGRVSDNPNDDIIIRIGSENSIEVAAWTLPCMTCHGEGGRGGIAVQDTLPPDIRWPTLHRAVVTATGRKRPAYPDRAAILRAITEGIDAGGNVLDSVMPRFRLQPAQRRALVAYLETLRPAGSP